MSRPSPPAWLNTLTPCNTILVLLIISFNKMCVSALRDTLSPRKRLLTACYLCLLPPWFKPFNKEVSQNAENSYFFRYFLLAQVLVFRLCAVIHTLKTHILIFSKALTWIITLRRRKLNSEGERRNVIFQCFRHVQDGEDFGIFNTGKKNCLMLFQIARGTQRSDLPQEYLRAIRSKIIFRA